MNPTPAQIRAARTAAGLTMDQLSQLLGMSGRMRISEYESGRKLMPQARWELMQYKLRIRTKQRENEK